MCRKKKKYLLILPLLSLLILAALLSLPFSRHYFIAAGESFALPPFFGAVLDYEVSSADGKTDMAKNNTLTFDSAGEYRLNAKLFGVLPWEEAAVSVYTEKEVVPGGQSVGLIMKTQGVIVVGYSAVTDEKGDTVYPAKEAGIALGDCLTKIDGVAVNGDEDVIDEIDKNGGDGEIVAEISRGGEKQQKKVKAYLCPETKRYRIGLYVRDNTGGVGTLTYYDPGTGRFGALGHTVAEAEDSGSAVLGRLIPASISSVNPAGNGGTGEKIGYFNPGAFEGKIDHIGRYGVFGVMAAPLENTSLPLVTTASPDEVKKGKAQMITVLEGEKMEWFDIEITGIDPEDKTGKGLSVTVTDKALIQRTGGIIQGMSGSPILQNGKLVGAVTYVTVNQPQKGFGCLIHYMMEEGA